MLSRSMIVFAQTRRLPPFSAFYSKLARSLSRVKPPFRMKVAGALWALTTPEYKDSPSSKHAERALALYKRYGNTVLAKARIAKRKKLAMRAKRMKVAKKSKVNAKLKVKRPSKVVSKVGKQSFKKTFQHLKGTKSKKSASGKQPAAGKQVKSLNSSKKNVRNVSQPLNKRTVPRASRKWPSSPRLPFATRRKLLGAAAGPLGANAMAKRSPYDAFRASLIKRGNLKPSDSLNRQIHRLWLLTSTQTHLSSKAREYMALRLIKKSLGGSKKVLPKKKKQPKVLTKSKSVRGKAVISKKKTPRRRFERSKRVSMASKPKVRLRRV
ncbi:unnamed protein product [Phytomonas sp. EM1]|nr:unnamed protein product [Phytomonas sp. EM1]|eukprot:CCW63291.1 unnamed protein product [Phytomonas sp. isolate EM1]